MDQKLPFDLFLIISPFYNEIFYRKFQTNNPQKDLNKSRGMRKKKDEESENDARPKNNEITTTATAAIPMPTVATVVGFLIIIFNLIYINNNIDNI